MAYQYLKPDNLVERFRSAKAYTDGLTDRFPEYERLARNKPAANVPKEYPKTTDGTTASIIRKTPHRIIQQLPTGRVRSDGEEWLGIIADFIYTKKIIPHANEGYALLQKCWTVIERFLTFGYTPTYTPFVQKNGYFCTDLRIPYWGDIFIQPGKVSDDDSNYVFLRSWWQTADIEALIETQSRIPKEQRTWDVEALARVKDIVIQKEEKAQSPSEREQKANAQGGVQLITGFQKGIGSKFYTFHVDTTEKDGKTTHNGTVVRVKENKDPRGEMPISFAYGDIDGTNPFGRSVVELVGGLQNLMDAEMQMYQYNRALMLNPPLLKKGVWNKNKAKFTPNAIIDLGSQENSSLEALTIDTTALANFPQNYGLMKSQALNLLASPDTSISSDIGNPGFSKTPQGVEASQANLSVDDNHFRKQFETWFERWSETAVNLYFAERQGIEELQLDKKTLSELGELAERGKFDMKMINKEGKIRIDYDTATPKLKFEVDASTSKMADEIKQLQSLQGLSDLLNKSQYLQEVVPPRKQMELWNSIVASSGVQDPDELEMSEKEIQEAIKNMEAAKQQSAAQEREIESTNYKDLPDWAKLQWLAKNNYQPPQSQDGTPPEVDSTEQKIKKADIMAKAQQSQGQGQESAPQEDGINPEHVLKADQQAHDQAIDVAKLELENKKIDQQAQQAQATHELSAATAAHQAKTTDEQLKSDKVKPAEKKPAAKKAPKKGK